MINRELLRNYREKNGHTYRSLANEINSYYGENLVAASTLCAWETKESARPVRSRLAKVAKYLNLELEDLYMATDTNEECVDSLRVKAIRMVLNADKEKLNEILQLFY